MTIGTHEYPRPQLRRADWESLNGTWQFALDPEAAWRRPDEVRWDDRPIRVPFAPETPASGIGETGFFCVSWYRRTFEAPALAMGERLVLHFGAVDFDAQVWVNGVPVARHRGGHTPFQAEITDYLQSEGPQEIVVRAEDDPHDLAQPRGKQDWELEPHGIWYPRTSGIWQTVWLERLPATAIGRLRWTANLERWEIGLAAWLDGERRDDLRLRVRLAHGERMLADDVYAVVDREVHRRIALSDPGISHARNRLLWRPGNPTLIEATLEVLGPDGTVIDAVESYTALRVVGTEGDRFMLNGRPLMLRLVLDQGYWPETGLTPPSDEALRRDVELALALGFNGVRKHQKIEDPRYLYWADRLGLLVWEEMPSAYRYTERAVDCVQREWTEAVRRDLSHPCIVAWVPLNESWGVPDLPALAEQRHYVQALYHLTKTLDPSRPVIGNDGWESVATDILGVHDYNDDAAVIAARYERTRPLSEVLARERPQGRRLALTDHDAGDRPVMLTEFGGIRLSDDAARTWGYSTADDAETFLARYEALLDAVHATSLFAGFCYTQFADTYQEANGLLYADRTPKADIERIARATRGRPRRWAATPWQAPPSPRPDGLARVPADGQGP